MSAGSIQTVVVCVPSTSATTAQQAACSKVGAQFYVPSKVQAYLLDPSRKNDIDAALGQFRLCLRDGYLDARIQHGRRSLLCITRNRSSSRHDTSGLMMRLGGFPDFL